MLEESHYYIQKAANSELERTMRKAYAATRETAKEKKLDLRTAAFGLAIRRVGQAVLSRRAIATKIEL